MRSSKWWLLFVLIRQGLRVVIFLVRFFVDFLPYGSKSDEGEHSQDLNHVRLPPHRLTSAMFLPAISSHRCTLKLVNLVTSCWSYNDPLMSGTQSTWYMLRRHDSRTDRCTCDSTLKEEKEVYYHNRVSSRCTVRRRQCRLRPEKPCIRSAFSWRRY